MQLGWRSGLRVVMNIIPEISDVYVFGVYTGASIEEIAHMYRANGKKIDRLFCFDSFVGLPPTTENYHEDWQEGSYNTFDYWQAKDLCECQDKICDFAFRNYPKPREVIFIQGFFNQSLTDELVKKCKMVQASYIDIDVDLYSSAKEVLDFVFKNKIADIGTSIGYDDWGGTPGWEECKDGESLAHVETMEKYGAECQLFAQFGTTYPQVQVMYKVINR